MHTAGVTLQSVGGVHQAGGVHQHGVTQHQHELIMARKSKDVNMSVLCINFLDVKYKMSALHPTPGPYVTTSLCLWKTLQNTCSLFTLNGIR